MRLAMTRWRNGLPCCCPLCRANLTTVFRTAAPNVLGRGDIGGYVNCHAIGDCWGNHFIYGMMDQIGERFVPSNHGDNVPYHPSALVHINPYGKW